VSGEYIVVLRLEYAESEIVRVGDVDPVVQSEEAFVVREPLVFEFLAGGLEHGVGGESLQNVSSKLFGVDDEGGAERGFEEFCGSEGGAELFLGKDRSAVVGIDCCIDTISPFGVDVPASCQSVGFGSQSTGAEADDKVELREVFGPAGLAAR
jgi:hypothetical protein